MKPFAYARPGTPEELFDLREARSKVQHGDVPPVVLKGGGMDLLDLAKNGVAAFGCLVDVTGLPGMRAIGEEPAGGSPLPVRPGPGPLLSVGAGVTLAALASAKEVRAKAPALSDAAAEAATPQVRNVATVVGNVLQLPRCAYFRDPFFDCRRRGGKSCPALEGEHAEGAIFGNGVCCSVHPSNVAVALLALEGVLELLEVGEDVETGKRSLAPGFRDFANLFRSDLTDRRGPTSLHPGEYVRRVLVPPCPASAYVEVDHKQSFDWASAAAAVALQLEGGKVRSARVALGHVAPVPMLSEAAAQALAGKAPDEAAATAAAEAAVKGATPLRDNAHKVQHLKVCVKRAVLKAAARGR